MSSKRLHSSLDDGRPAQSTTNAALATVTCTCGKVGKNQRGVHIHQGRSGCQPGQHIVNFASESQVYVSLDATQRTEELFVQGQDKLLKYRKKTPCIHCLFGYLNALT